VSLLGRPGLSGRVNGQRSPVYPLLTAAARLVGASLAVGVVAKTACCACDVAIIASEIDAFYHITKQRTNLADKRQCDGPAGYFVELRVYAVPGFQEC